MRNMKYMLIGYVVIWLLLTLFGGHQAVGECASAHLLNPPKLHLVEQDGTYSVYLDRANIKVLDAKYKLYQVYIWSVESRGTCDTIDTFIMSLNDHHAFYFTTYDVRTKTTSPVGKLINYSNSPSRSWYEAEKVILESTGGSQA